MYVTLDLCPMPGHAIPDHFTNLPAVFADPQVNTAAWIREWRVHPTKEAANSYVAQPGTLAIVVLPLQLEDDGSGRPAHQQRVLAEERDLADKLERLQTFLASPAAANLEPAEVSRMRAQASAMATYRHVLRDRIAAW